MMSDIRQDTQAKAAGAVVETAITEMPDTIATPFQLDGVTQRTAYPAPALGENTDAILSEAGFTNEEIAALKASGAAA